ncbi:MAG TPA: hypothetical protein PKZ53_09220 [Acidobacteriota bacterium]|nr:hypothetical protein [Acidobacteriota bacterium]
MIVPSFRKLILGSTLTALCLGATWMLPYSTPVQAASLSHPTGQNDAGKVPEYISDMAGIKFKKPAPDWQVLDSGPELVQRILCLPPGETLSPFSPRLVILVYPASAVVGGMEFRRQQVSTVTAEGKVKLTQLKFENSSMAGKDAVLYSYDLEFQTPIHTVEYGFVNQGNFYVVQIAAVASEWEKPEFTAMMDKALKSVGFVKIPNLNK